MKTNLKIYIFAYKKFLIGLICLIAVILIATIVKVVTAPPSPVPTSIKSQANFKVIYPSGYSYASANWNYKSDQKQLAYTVNKDGYSVAVTEQKTPLAYQDDPASYDRFIGSLRPSANFKVALGTVSIVHFVTAGDFQPAGSSGVLNAKGTLIIATPSRNLSDDEWRALFSSLKT